MLPTLRFTLPSMQDKLRHLHPETHAVHITLSRINIANIKIGRMRFAPTLTNVRQHPEPHLVLCHSLKITKFSFFVSREVSSPLQYEINVLFLSY